MTKSKARAAVLGIANHWKTLGFVFFLSILIPAGIYSVIEPYTFIQSLEWAVYMITSTGLGAHGASTFIGQVMGVVLMIWGPVILMALFTGVIVNALRVDPNAFTDEEQVTLLADTALVAEWVREQRAKEYRHNGTVHIPPLAKDRLGPVSPDTQYLDINNL